jgi:hypothetical protein
MEVKGLVKREGTGRRGNPLTYSLTAPAGIRMESAPLKAIAA